FGSYDRVEKVFILMTVVFFAYPAAALVSRPEWTAVARGAFLPTLHRDPEYIFLLVGLIGTTITPYMHLFQQSSIVERGAGRRRYGPERTDAYVGVGFSNLMSVFMIMATAATLHRTGTLYRSTLLRMLPKRSSRSQGAPRERCLRSDSSGRRCSRAQSFRWPRRMHWVRRSASGKG